MEINRKVPQSRPDAATRVAFCLDQLESADEFKGGLDWTTAVVPRLTLEELIGALVAAEQELEELEDPPDDSDTPPGE